MVADSGRSVGIRFTATAAGRIPLGRPARPEEVAGALSWQLSADAFYTTGAVLRVAGGL
ncbi:MAG: SDR family oxidoreductase [Kutzneria sp.]|nr:SDR family oxidoreductase [Kutzneria sp.]